MKKRGQSVPILKNKIVPLKYNLEYIQKEFFRNMVKESLLPNNNLKLQRSLKADYKVDDIIKSKLNSAEEHNIKVMKLFENAHTAEDFKQMGMRADQLANTFKTEVEKMINDKGDWYEMIKERGPLLDIDYSTLDEIDLYMYPSPDMKGNQAFKTQRFSTVHRTAKKPEPKGEDSALKVKGNAIMNKSMIFTEKMRMTEEDFNTQFTNLIDNSTQMTGDVMLSEEEICYDKEPLGYGGKLNQRSEPGLAT